MIDTATDTMTVAEASDLLGVSERQVRRQASDGKIPHRKEGKAYLFDRAVVEELAAERMAEDGADDPDPTDVADSPGATMSEGASAAQVVGPPPDPLLGRGGGSAPADLDQVFADVRAAVDQHLQRTRTFHQTLHAKIDALERTLRFELGRNEEVRRGLEDILRGLGLKPNQVSEIRIDPRPRTDLWSEVRGWWKRLVKG